nr:hypothetical protein [Paenibacillus sp. Leaf72]
MIGFTQDCPIQIGNIPDTPFIGDLINDWNDNQHSVFDVEDVLL